VVNKFSNREQQGKLFKPFFQSQFRTDDETVGLPRSRFSKKEDAMLLVTGFLTVS